MTQQPDGLAEAISRMVDEALSAGFAQYPGDEAKSAQLIARKAQAVVPISTHLLMDMGVIPDTRPPRPPTPPPTRRQRFGEWRARLRMRLATRAYEIISGEDAPLGLDQDDW